MFSFERAKQTNQVRLFLRQLVDRSSPNIPPSTGEHRAESRSHRALPVLIAPWDKKGPAVAEATFALTKDFSDRGLSIVLPQPFRTDQVLVGLWLDEMCYAQGVARQNVALGGGFWQLGVELQRTVDAGDYPELEQLAPLAARLLPPAAGQLV